MVVISGCEELVSFRIIIYSLHNNIITYFDCLVSGEANFTMSHTALTVGGFIQPAVARGLIEHPSNIEKDCVRDSPQAQPYPIQ